VGPRVGVDSANLEEQEPGPSARRHAHRRLVLPAILGAACALVLINAIKIICSVSVDAPPFYPMGLHFDRLCGLVVSVPTYISRGPGSIPATTTFFEQ
jgi:hypothetical protein